MPTKNGRTTPLENGQCAQTVGVIGDMPLLHVVLHLIPSVIRVSLVSDWIISRDHPRRNGRKRQFFPIFFGNGWQYPQIDLFGAKGRHLRPCARRKGTRKGSPWRLAVKGSCQRKLTEGIMWFQAMPRKRKVLIPSVRNQRFRTAPLTHGGKGSLSGIPFTERNSQAPIRR